MYWCTLSCMHHEKGIWKDVQPELLSIVYDNTYIYIAVKVIYFTIYNTVGRVGWTNFFENVAFKNVVIFIKYNDIYLR